MRLDRAFYAQPTVTVAQALLGKELVFGPYRGYITETEAYVAASDPACHAARGWTPRTAVMFGPPGYSYVYFIYGMYHCLNVVTEAEGVAAGVLIRGLDLHTPAAVSLPGPGKLCRHLGITLVHKGVDLVTAADFYINEAPPPPTFQTTPRIGIKVGTDKLWRFVVPTR